MFVSNFLFFFPMNIGCWNIRGFNDPLKHSELRHLIQHHRVTFLGWLKLGLENQINIMFLDLFLITILTCMIMNLLVVVEFGFVGIQMR
jgi:hypothetical protein